MGVSQYNFFSVYYINVIILNSLNHVKYFCDCSILTETSISVLLACSPKTFKTIQTAEKPK